MPAIALPGTAFRKKGVACEMQCLLADEGGQVQRLMLIFNLTGTVCDKLEAAVKLCCLQYL